MSRLEFLILVLQSCNCFDVISFFFSFVQFISYCLRRPCSIDVFRVLVFLWVFLKGREQCFCSFYRTKSSNCFAVKTHVFKRSFSVNTFVCNHEALNLRLQVLAVPACVTIARPKKTSQAGTFTDWICEIEFFDGYKYNNVFFLLYFLLFWCYSS